LLIHPIGDDAFQSDMPALTTMWRDGFAPIA
jgi:hypothetical protein